ncbi:MAG TPA: 30S ribosomal protein S20 [Bdellovibrionota bacterium]|nr:30S ribosomal protein S20 [Bdellovibrionota bacterium]
MAIHKSAEKRARQNTKRAARNRSHRTSVRTAIKNVRVAVTSKDLMKAKEALRIAIPKIDRAVNHGVMKKETASRNISRLTRAVNQIAG